MKSFFRKQLQSFLAEARKHGYDAELKGRKIPSRPGVDQLTYPRDKNPRTAQWFWEDICEVFEIKGIVQ